VLVGKRLKDVHFRQTYGAAVLGVHRSGDCQLSNNVHLFLLSANCLPHQCISTVNELLAGSAFFAEQPNQRQTKHLACKPLCCSRALNAKKGTMLEHMPSSNLHCLHPLLCMTAGVTCRASCFGGHQRHPTVCRRYLSG
jgi:hypothetical protein